MENQARTSPTATAKIDQITQDRLARLAARRNGGAPVSAYSTSRSKVGPTGRTTPPAAGGRSRKRHAAKASRTAALVMSVATSVGLSAYFHQADATASANASTSASSNSATTPPAPSTTATATAVTPTARTTSTGLADGTYAGATSSNRWGPVQVQITVTGGTITDVTAVQTPSDRNKSIAINNEATPILASEALTAQSANIDTVSGATYTSNSYKVSLQSAIDLARAATLKSGVSA